MKLELYYPVKPYIIGQKFGETAFLDYYKSNGVIFSGHNGIDLAAIHGEEVRAAHDGIIDVQVDEKQGHGVVITTDKEYEYKDGTAYFRSIYWHLIDNIPVKKYQKVKAGDVIGYADSTGLSTGDHLHFGLKPAKLVPGGSIDRLETYNIEADNNMQGAIDPTLYFNGKYASDLGAKFIFTKDLQYGQTNDDVRQLQRRLQSLGYFPRAQEPTGFYGPVTREAVFSFQQDYITGLSWWATWIGRGKYCSSQTRAALNNL